MPNVVRVNQRPEGIELVLSEWAPDDVLTGRCGSSCTGVTCPGPGDAADETMCLGGSCVTATCAADPVICPDAPCVPDPLYPQLAADGVTCNHLALPSDTTGGYMGTVFEIPPVGTPLPYRDTP